MNAPALPSTSAPVAAPASTSAAPTAVPSGDFLLMLGQLVGAPVAPTARGTKAPLADLPGTAEAEQAVQDAAALVGTPQTIATAVSQVLAKAGEGTDVLQPAPVPVPNAGLLAATATKEASQLMADGAAIGEMQTDARSLQAPPAPSDAAASLRPTIVTDSGPTRTLHQPVGDPAWADELGTRMIMMSERGQHAASLRLSPEHLGPLEVRITVRDDQASVWFGAANADTRAALEQALPRLRELFASQGLALADAGVHHEAPRERHQTVPSPSVTSGSGDPSLQGESVEVAAQVRLGLVDAYA